ncbi:MAG: hypothetical protein AAFZ80_02435 [Cyanobacteria bacterium P01_A01_bin.105]
MKFNVKKFSVKTFGLLAASLTLVAGVRAVQAMPPHIADSLNLTEQQQAEFDTLRAETRSQIEAILTSEQRSAVQSRLEAGEPMRQVLRSLDLTEQQRTEIRAVAEGARETGQQILTPEQQAQLQEHRRERRGRAGGKSMMMSAEVAAELNLTADQRAQLDILRTNNRAQLESVLTDAQAATVISAIEDGGNIRQVMRSLNLSNSQRSELRSLFESSREATQEILTEAQQEQLQAMQQTRRQNRPERRR